MTVLLPLLHTKQLQASRDPSGNRSYKFSVQKTRFQFFLRIFSHFFYFFLYRKTAHSAIMVNKVAIIIYSTYGHIAQLAEQEKLGVEAAGGHATIYQVPETLPDEILEKMHAPKKPDYPLATLDVLKEHNAFIFGFPTRYGAPPAQFKAFWDATGGLWATGALHGKYFGVFVSTGTLGGGQEATVMNSLSNFVHHGMIFVPLGYKNTFPYASNLDEVHGGSAWGAGTFAAADGSRSPTELELTVAKIQGQSFYQTVDEI
ncbi:ubiquitinated histone-like protein Uhp1 [Schizosaccharomyces japonicus yFS275]|uniref:Ubiquitinated histone-like protein Uhp1 n=1 Tax=Schizosaccharomyces japonicus (strain yFS275 / FY16936) TaxID=402676 RepID=B6K0X9_SCHJY|nr:ubiquitinated histone-like protein Uhp1 [Schizosaccharomyces japonicus yFS275]EEB07600.2 ubiquitinated histone-like protein Uhp1 [Schizosaccharomyces japonicus yFS275]